MGDELNKLWQQKAPARGGASAAVMEPPAPEEKINRQLEDRGWCLCRFDKLFDGEAIVITANALITNYPQGYPVYTTGELSQALGLDDKLLQAAHRAKKELGARIEVPGGWGEVEDA